MSPKQTVKDCLLIVHVNMTCRQLLHVSLAADVAAMCRQLGTNLVIPGGARVIEAKGRLIIPGMSDAVYYRLLAVV